MIKALLIVLLFCGIAEAAQHIQVGDAAGGSLSGTYPNPTITSLPPSSTNYINNQINTRQTDAGLNVSTVTAGVFTTPLSIYQPLLFGAYSGELIFKQAGFNAPPDSKGALRQIFFGTVGNPLYTGSIFFEAIYQGCLVTGGCLVVDRNGGVGVNALQNGTTFYVNGNMAIGSGVKTSASSSAPDDGLYVQNGIVLGGSTIAQFQAATPKAAGQGQYCTDCSNTINCESTGTAKGAWSAQQATNRSAICN